MNIQKIKINKLKRAEYNPRVELVPEDKEYQSLKKSIVEFGYVVPVIVNTDMTVIGGHQGLTVLEDLGYTEIECNVVDLDKNQEKALNIALNKINGKWDYDKLSNILNELVNSSEIDATLTGFSESEIEDLDMDYIEDLLNDDYATTDKTLNKFAITFNISKEHEEKFSNYIKKHGKDYLIELMINEVERYVI